MKYLIVKITVLLLILIGCTLPESPPVNPQAAILITPLDDETCLDGVSINDTQSEVFFSWTPALDAISYEIILTNLFSLNQQIFSVKNNEISLILKKDEPYQWYVKSIGEEGSLSAESEIWKFYLAGDAIINFAPFPSDLISPESGSTITTDINNNITLSWKASDVDGDLHKFELYLDQKNPPTLTYDINYTQQEVFFEVEVEKNKTYYWKVIAFDISGNQSDSGVYAFRTN